MKPAKDLADAERLAAPGEWIMVRGHRHANPDWCVMTEAERMLPQYSWWTSWVQMPVEQPDTRRNPYVEGF